MTMNVEVCLKTAAKDTTSKFELRVDENDTVGAVKEKIAAAQMVTFPEQTLMFNGEKMSEDKALSSFGVKEASCLDFVIEATEESIVKQMSDLLKHRDLTCDELGLLYCYKFGVSANQALKTIGVNMALQDFVASQGKSFVLDGKKVSLVRKDTTLQPLSVSKQLEELLRENGPTMEINALCSKFVQKFHVSVGSIVNSRPIEFLQQEPAFAVLGTGMVTLKEFEAAEKAKLEARTARSQSPGIRKAVPVEWRRERSTERGLGRQSPARARQSPARSRPVALSQQKAKDDSMYQDLHTKISSRSFNSRVAQVLSTVADVVKESCFLNIAEVVKGGSVGKGTAIEECSDATLVFFVKGLPTTGHQKWMAPLLKSVRATLEDKLKSDLVTDLECTEDSVKMMAKNLVQLELKFSPAFESYGATVQTLGGLGPNVRKSFEPSFVKESTQFISKQPGHVKVTMRLLKWWREQQQWSCALTRPSDDLLELLAVYVAQQCGKVEQVQMISNCMSVMARFDQLRVVWSNFYGKNDVWSPLMMQKPLLMDPVNPFRNVADPQEFDPRELMSLAASTHFFW